MIPRLPRPIPAEGPCEHCDKPAPFQGINYGGFAEYWHEACAEGCEPPEPDPSPSSTVEGAYAAAAEQKYGDRW